MKKRFKLLKAFVCTFLVLLVASSCGIRSANEELNKDKICLKDNKDNIIDFNQISNKRSRLLKYKVSKDEVIVRGFPKKASFIDLVGSSSTMPEEIQAGDWIKLTLNSKDENFKLGIRGFNEDCPDGEWLACTSDEIDFVVPDLSDYTGLAIRLYTKKSKGIVNAHLIPKVSIVEKDTYREPLLTLIDDDGDIHFLLDVLPLIEDMHVPIATAVTTKRIGSSERWMSWDNIKECTSRGAECLCHTYNHPKGSEVKDIDFDTLCSWNKLALESLTENGFSVKGIVYSSSSGFNKKVQNAAKPFFDYGVVIGGDKNNYRCCDPYALFRYRIDCADTEGREDWNLDDMRSYIDSVKKNGGWQIWMFHTSSALWRQRVQQDEKGEIILDGMGQPIPMVDGEENPVLDVDGSFPTMGRYVYLPMLKDAIQYAQDQGVKIVSSEEAYEKYFAS